MRFDLIYPCVTGEPILIPNVSVVAGQSMAMCFKLPVTHPVSFVEVSIWCRTIMSGTGLRREEVGLIG